jgi:N-acetylneuraminate synthase/N,N'-diacetyllegionaminate synthase
LYILLYQADHYLYMQVIDLGVRKIGCGQPCFIIGEAGVNHNGDLDLAKRLVDAAVEAGADAVKFQTFQAAKLISSAAPKAEYQKATTGNSDGQLEMVRRLEMSPEMTCSVAEYAAKKKIIFLSTGFDEESIDLLDSLGVPAFKIGSGDITALPLLEFVARKRKPVILSTGMSYLAEVESGVAALVSSGCPGVALLHCVSSYPADAKSANLRAILTLRDHFQMPVGFSDHSLGIEVAIAAVAMGARIVEKHLTIDVDLPGPDHRVSLMPEAFRSMTQAIRLVEASLGDGVKQPTASELNVRDVARRSIVTARTIPKRTVITREMLTCKRPGTGISPTEINRILGRVTQHEIPIDTLLTEDDLA